MSEINQNSPNANQPSSSNSSLPPRQSLLGQTLELEVESLAAGGRGVAKYNGLATFVDRALPGQRILASVSADKGRLLEAKLLEVLRPGPDEIKPECPHFGVCGGCSWQHLSYPAQLTAKHQILLDCLARLGRQSPEALTQANIPPALPSPELWFFRNKMEFAFAPGEITFAPSEGIAQSPEETPDKASEDALGETSHELDDNLPMSRPLLGLRRRNSHEVEEVTHCRLQSPLTMRVLAITRQWLEEETRQGHVFRAWEETPNTRLLGNPQSKAQSKSQNKSQDNAPKTTPSGAILRHLVVREPKTLLEQNGQLKKQCLVELITTPASRRDCEIFKGLGLRLEQELGDETLFGFVHSTRSSRSNIAPNIARGEKTAYRLGLAQLQEDFIDCNADNCNKLTLTFRPQSFMQTNSEAAAKLLEQAAAWTLQEAKKGKGTASGAEKSGHKLTLWDVYCGVGAFSLYLGRALNNAGLGYNAICGLELSTQAVKDAANNAVANNLENCFFYNGDAEDILGSKQTASWPRPDLVLLDPPRTGLKEKLCRSLLKLAPELLILVSCDPATLGRDIAMLNSGYELVEGRIFDLFPHSAHLESMVLLRKKKFAVASSE